MKALYWLSVLGTLILIDCSGSKISVTQAPDAEFKPIQRLAIMPDSGVLGDAIAKELLDRGLNIITEDETVAMVGGIRINQIGVSAREYYAAPREKGVDAMLTASARIAQDGRPELRQCPGTGYGQWGFSYGYCLAKRLGWIWRIRCGSRHAKKYF